MKTPPRKPGRPFAEFLDDEHRKLLSLQCRQYALEAFEKEWAASIRGKEWVMWDEAAFRMVADSDAKNVIDLCSWMLGTADTGPGLMGRIKADYLKAFPPKRKWGKPEKEATFAHHQDEAYAARRLRLFPKAAGRTLNHQDADEMIAAFEKRIDPVVADRNKNRAHAYEYRDHGTAPILSLAEIRAHFDQAHQLLNDFSLVARGSTWAGNDLNPNRVEFTAYDLVDVIFLPHWFRNAPRIKAMTRDAIYDALHTDLREGPFNSHEKLVTLAERESYAAE